MASAIDPTKPTGPVAYTADVRANFSAAKSEIEALQTTVATGGPFLPIAGGTLTGPLTLSGNPATDLQAAAKQYVDNRTAAVLRPKASLTNRFGVRRLKASLSQSSGAYTLSDQVCVAAAGFSWVRLCYTNRDTGNTGRITSAAISPTSSAADGYTPKNALGATDNTMWVPVTFNNACANTELAAQIAPAVTGGSVVQGGTGYSNGTNVQLTIAGTAGGPPPVLLCTVTAGAITAVTGVQYAGSCAYLPPNPVRLIGGNNDCTINLTPGSAPNPASGFAPNAGSNATYQRPTYWSDWTPVQSLGRTDGGIGTLILARNYLAAGQTYYGAAQPNPVAVSASVVAGGTGYPDGQLVLTATGNTPDDAPTFLVSCNGGAVASVVSVRNPGAYTGTTFATFTSATTGGGNNDCTLSVTTSAFNSVAVTGREYFSCYKNGDCITTPGNFTAPTLGVGLCWGVEFIGNSLGLSVLHVGDSIVAGFHTTADCMSYGPRACAQASTALAPISYINCGTVGEPSQYFVTNAKQEIDNWLPNVVIIQAWSGNDPMTQVGADQAWSRAMLVADYARTKGAVAILAGPVPQPTKCTNATLDSYRLTANARGAALAASGGLFLNISAIVGDGASPQNYLANFDSGDHTHMNSVGADAIATPLATMLQRIAGVVI